MNRHLLSIAPLTAALALLLTSATALAQAEQDSGATFFTKPAGSAAPDEFGWQLPPDDSGRWGGIQLPGDMDPKPFQLSRFFPNGIQLGHLASIWPGGNGPDFRVYQAGLVAIADFSKNDLLPAVYGDAEVGGPDAAQGVNLFKAQTFDQMDDVPELLAPRWAEIADTAELAGVEACADKQQVFFWASRIDPTWQPADDETDKLVITWKNMVPRGSDCSNPDEVLTFQLSLTARVGLADNGKPLARVEYAFGNCGWTVPMVADPANASGPRTGLILDGANDEPRVAIELLGEQEARAEVRPGIGLGVDDERLAVPGVSGDPLRGSEYCQGTNLEWEVAAGEDGAADRRVPSEPGRFVIDLGPNGLPLEDADDDGVTAANDNCDDEYNPLQANKNNSEFGDVCDRDVDGDRLENTVDNCVFVTNARQEDADGDGEGDACDETASDADRDGWFFPVLSPPADGGGGWWVFHIKEDNCPQAWNRLQWDFDSDGRGDTCDDWEDTLVYFLSQLSKSGSFDELKSSKNCDGSGQSSACDAMRWAITEIVWANTAASLTKAELDKMLFELFAQWSKTKATFAEFLTWSAEKQRDLSKKYR